MHGMLLMIKGFRKFTMFKYINTEQNKNSDWKD